MTDIALSLFRPTAAQTAPTKSARVRVKGRWSYRLLVWAFRNS